MPVYKQSSKNKKPSKEMIFYDIESSIHKGTLWCTKKKLEIKLLNYGYHFQVKWLYSSTEQNSSLHLKSVPISSAQASMLVDFSFYHISSWTLPRSCV